jgi:hypothetical protein
MEPLAGAGAPLLDAAGSSGPAGGVATSLTASVSRPEECRNRRSGSSLSSLDQKCWRAGINDNASWTCSQGGTIFKTCFKHTGLTRLGGNWRLPNCHPLWDLPSTRGTSLPSRMESTLAGVPGVGTLAPFSVALAAVSTEALLAQSSSGVWSSLQATSAGAAVCASIYGSLPVECDQILESKTLDRMRNLLSNLVND